MSRILRLRNGSSLDLVGLVVLGTSLVAIAFLSLIIAPLVSLYRHPPTVSMAKRDSAAALAKFRSSVGQQVAIVDNRSWFFDPKPPEPEKGDIGSHRTYSGPSLIAYIDGTAWFSDGSKLSEKEPKSSSLKLVKANPPWGATVEWEGGKYDVEMFKKSTAASLRDTLTSNAGYSYPLTTGSAHLGGKPPSDRKDLPADAKSGPGVLPAGSAPAPATAAAASATPSSSPPSAPPAQGDPGAANQPPPQPPGDQPPPPPPGEPNAAAPRPTSSPASAPVASSPSPAPSDSSKEPAAASPETARPSHP